MTEQPVLLRIQLSRQKGWRMPPNTAKVDRSTKWGNPLVPGKISVLAGGRPVQDKRHAFCIYRASAPDNSALVAAARAELKGRNLGCWCRLCAEHREGKPFDLDCPACDPCHVDVLGPLANGAAG